MYIKEANEINDDWERLILKDIDIPNFTGFVNTIYRQTLDL